ncbi:cytochrome P450 [Streptomyces caniferus]|uniref:cytochrome P450 n=1 Tax=Streptomyces caniferus TaxID=285557 RepID=UPI003451BB1F
MADEAEEAAQGLPPGPCLDAEAWRTSEREQLSSLRAFRRAYGPVFTVYGAGRPPRVYIAEPSAIEDIFVRHQADLEGLGPSLFKPLVTDRSVAFLNAERHRQARHLLGHALDTDNPDCRARTITGIVSRATNRLRTGEDIPLEVFASDVTRDVILALCLGSLPARRHTELRNALDRAMNVVHEQQTAVLSPCPGEAAPTAAAVTQAIRVLDDLLLHETRRRRGQSGAPMECIADRLTARSATNGELCDHGVVVHLKTLLVSGHETTSAALAWTLLHLARSHEVLHALRQELTAQPPGHAPVALLRLPYLEAVCLEALRLSSPVPNGGARTVVRAFQAQGYVFRPGTEVVPAIHLTHQSERVFPHPHLFDPHRFTGRRYRSSAFLPFGIGPRYCLGAAIALQELSLAVAVVVRQDDLQVVDVGEGAGSVSMGPTVRVPDTVVLRRCPPRLSDRQEGKR